MYNYMQVVACLSKSVSAFYRKNNPLLVNGLTINYRHMNTIICHDSSTSRYKLVPKNKCVLLRLSVIPFCWIETTLF